MSASNKPVRPKGADCGAMVAFEVIGSKWTMLIIGTLGKNESLRYSDLRRSISGISQRMLTLTLRSLEENGIVKRTMLPTSPPRVDYELTPLGRTLFTPLKALKDWAHDNLDAMADARDAYARRAAV